MRQIKNDGLAVPQGWDDKAEKAKTAVLRAPANSKQAAIETNKSLWGELKEALGVLSHYKCYYCETARVRDDFEVDHFRPKSFSEGDDHKGYWWLAFEKSNFRFSCKFCNQRRIDKETGIGGGKSSQFPLLAGSIRATKPEDSLEDEYPSLLDPIVDLEHTIISFDDTGVAVPFVNKNIEPDNFERARTSIRAYNLNHGYLRRRREQKALQIKAKVAEISHAHARYIRRHKQNNPQAALDAKHDLELRLVELVGLMDPKEEYASCALAVVRLLSNPNRPWLHRVVANAKE